VSRRATVLAIPAVVLALLLGAAAWVVTDKRVTLRVDGSARVVRTHAATVGAVLDQAGLSVQPHDLLSPSRSASLANGAQVVLRRGRPVTVEVDGQVRHIWVTARSVDELLGQIGYRDANIWLSASRSRRIPLGGISLQLRTPKRATVVADGRATVLDTTVPTVGALLALDHVTLAPTDVTSVPVITAITDGIVVTVHRIRHTVGTVGLAVPPSVIRRGDAGLYLGETKVVDRGAPGMIEQRWAYTSTDGKVTAKKLTGQSLKTRPRPEIVAVGTRARPAAPAPAPRPAPAPVQQAATPAPRPAPPASGGLNWGALANCESGGNPQAYSPAGPYYGLYQFSAGTWASVGGSGLPSSASSSEQTYRASLLYQRSGAGQWPVCGHFLFS